MVTQDVLEELLPKYSAQDKNTVYYENQKVQWNCPRKDIPP